MEGASSNPYVASRAAAFARPTGSRLSLWRVLLGLTIPGPVFGVVGTLFVWGVYNLGRYWASELMGARPAFPAWLVSDILVYAVLAGTLLSLVPALNIVILNARHRLTTLRAFSTYATFGLVLSFLAACMIAADIDARNLTQLIGSLAAGLMILCSWLCSAAVFACWIRWQSSSRVE